MPPFSALAAGLRLRSPPPARLASFFRGIFAPLSGGIPVSRFVPAAALSSHESHRKTDSGPGKNLLRARYAVLHEPSPSVSPLPLSPADFPHHSLLPSQAVGFVAAAQSNLMRVIVESAGGTPDQTDVFGGDPREGRELLCVVRALLKKIRRRVLVGDRVLVGSVDWAARQGMIEDVFHRSSEIADPHVANVERLLVLFAMDQPKVEPFALTRFLVDAESTGVPLTLALNKAELVDDETLSSWNERLHGWGYNPVFCSVDQKSGIHNLEDILKGKTTVVIGPSGVGKSSLVNCLRIPSDVYDEKEINNLLERYERSKWLGEQRVSAVSKSGKGKHTTGYVSLLPLLGGGYIADTPGFNQPSLIKVTKRSLATTFPEIRQMLNASKCAFSDCLHIGEPGCIVKGDWERYAYYLQLLDEIRIREEFQLRTFGTKREDEMRYKVRELGVKQAEPRLELKKHRRLSRKLINQSILDDGQAEPRLEHKKHRKISKKRTHQSILDDDDDIEDYLSDVEEAVGEEDKNQGTKE